MSNKRQLTDSCNSVNGLYALGSTIGKGHFAVVKSARHIFSQRDVAVKVIEKSKLDAVSKAHLFREVTCMKLVRHPNIVRLYDVIDTPSRLFLILEFGDGGDMYDYIMKHVNGLSESLARKYFQQICQGLEYCHEMRVCHRDLKPENLVFFEKQGVVKLTDFGFSNQFSPDSKLLTSCGSLVYSAPEILLGDPYDASAIDIWSLGVILFMLVTGRAPFQEANEYETVMMILDCSYKLPSTVSAECQSLIHRIIVREPEKRATLQQVMSDVWYQPNDEHTDAYPVLSYRTLSRDHHQAILRQMIAGHVADQETILKALEEDEYNHITATYYLLAEKLLHEKSDPEERPVKRQKRLVPHVPNDLAREQIGGFPSPSIFNFDDVSLPITRRNSFDDVESEGYDASHEQETQSSILTNSRHSLDSTGEHVLNALLEDDEEERPSGLQPRSANINTSTNPATVAQAMNMILEEDENPESPSPDKTVAPLQQLATLPKLNKIVENGVNDENFSIGLDNSTTASGILRSKDLRSLIESKRRNFSRSCSSSDSEETASNHEINRLFNRKSNHSPNSLQESEPLVNSTNPRGRSFSNIDHLSADTLANHQPSTAFGTTNESNKRRSFSRTSSVISNSRLASTGATDDVNNDHSGNNSFIFHPDRPRSLSNDHRLANQSQMSISSRVSIRYSTPRESTVFTKNDAPMVVRLLQQTSHQDPIDAIKTIIEHQRLQMSMTPHEQLQKAVIVEEDLTLPAINISKLLSKSPITPRMSNEIESIPSTTVTEKLRPTNGDVSPVPKSSRSVLSTVRHCLIKHQRRKSNSEDLSRLDKKPKYASRKHRSCCTVS